ncbi:MAG: hypothetical protein WCF85_15155 [Rhodospirillaceae bacterium]
MNDHQHRRLGELINDPICRLMMARDGVEPHDVLKLFKSVKPLVRKTANIHLPLSNAA